MEISQILFLMFFFSLVFAMYMIIGAMVLSLEVFPVNPENADIKSLASGVIWPLYVLMYFVHHTIPALPRFFVEFVIELYRSIDEAINPEEMIDD